MPRNEIQKQGDPRQESIDEIVRDYEKLQEEKNKFWTRIENAGKRKRTLSTLSDEQVELEKNKDDAEGPEPSM